MYILVDNAKLAEAISTAFYSLTVPEEAEGQTTKTWCSWVVHPSNGQAVLNIPDSAWLRVHPQSKPSIFDNLIGDVITQEEKTKIHYILDVCRQGGSLESDAEYIPGYQLKIINYLPPSLLNRKKTLEQLQKEGWFPDI